MSSVTVSLEVTAPSSPLARTGLPVELLVAVALLLLVVGAVTVRVAR